jgi:hypothetical protein
MFSFTFVSLTMFSLNHYFKYKLLIWLYIIKFNPCLAKVIVFSFIYVILAMFYQSNCI